MSVDHDLHINTHITVPETAEVADITAAQLRRWVRTSEARRKDGNPRGTIISSEDRLSSGQGSETLLSQHTVMQIFVAARLTERGVAVDDALDAGRRFAHTGYEGRDPSEAFSQGTTWLLVAGSESQVVNIGKHNSDSHSDCYRYRSLEVAVSVFEDYLSNQGFGDPVAIAVTALNLTVAPNEITCRIKKVLQEKRPRNNRLNKNRKQING
ncbi:MAG: hypothetical protein AAF720_00815 [Pseudomonadota bacterium]